MQVLTMKHGHHESHDSAYAVGPWIDQTDFHQQQHHSHHPGQQQPQQQTTSPIYPYATYIYPHSSALPMNPVYSMAQPPPYVPAHHHHPHQQPLPLSIPTTTMWPSQMLSNRSPSYSTPTAILPRAPMSTPLSASTNQSMTPLSAGGHSLTTPTTGRSTTQRTKLTDDDRRAICEYAAQHTHMKQTDIGREWHVERSTISKILRQKDKYINAPKDESTSPLRPSKKKMPDVERTLLNWAKNEQKKGLLITDDKLQQQVQVFCALPETAGGRPNSVWLESFKEKYLSNGKLRKSKTDVSLDPVGLNIVDSSTTSLMQSPHDYSPTSSNGLNSPPLSPDEDGLRSLKPDHQSNGLFGYNPASAATDHSQSLDFVLSNVSHADSLLSPMSPELAKTNSGLVISTATSEDSLPALGSISLRQRSQTFPIRDGANMSSRPGSSAGGSGLSQAAPEQTLSMHSTSSIDPRATLKRNNSFADIRDHNMIYTSSMRPPPLPRADDMMSSSSSPTITAGPGSSSPNHDDVRRALHTVKAYMKAQEAQRPGILDGEDFVFIGKLMEKLRLPPRSPISNNNNADAMLVHAGSGAGNGSGSGSGSRNAEMIHSPRLKKKRTIVDVYNS